MLNENAPQDEQEKKPKTEKSSTSPLAQALKVMENAEVVKDSKRQIVDGSLLGTCLVFIAAMLGLQIKQMDTPLTVALTSFAIAIPMLTLGFMQAGYKPKPGWGWQVLGAISIFAWMVETVGAVFVAVGVFAVIAHLSPLAFKTSLWTAGIVAVAALILPCVGFIIYVAVQVKREQKKQ